MKNKKELIDLLKKSGVKIINNTIAFSMLLLIDVMKSMGKRIFVTTDIAIKNINTVRRMNPTIIHAELNMK